MAKRGQSLNSIKLKDFPENKGLADDFFDREFEDDNPDEDTVIITRDEIPEDEDGTSGLTVRSLSSLFDEDDVSAGNTTIISRELLDEAGNLKEDQPAETKADTAEEVTEETEEEKMAPAPKKVQPRKPSSDQISRNPKPAEQFKEKKPPKMPKVKDFGKKKHSAAYRIIKFCIFLLIWIAVAFACYQGYKFGYKVLNDQPMDSADASKIQITVTGNETDEEMGEILLQNKLIDDVGIYKWRCLLYKSEYIPGTFKLSRSYNTEKILNILAGYNYSEGTMEDESTSETAAAEQAPEETAVSEAETTEAQNADNGEAVEVYEEGGDYEEDVDYEEGGDYEEDVNYEEGGDGEDAGEGEEGGEENNN
ncbi:MAG: hypothetical protein E7233_06040 [Lachnospiraceae bacterium]|nr:hypothetical protein [Lachnospiraceae bacterium]